MPLLTEGAQAIFFSYEPAIPLRVYPLSRNNKARPGKSASLPLAQKIPMNSPPYDSY